MWPDHLGATGEATAEGVPHLLDRDKQAGGLHLL